jgi:hypothetical protein
MFRFPYRRVWVEPAPAIAPAQPGFLARLVGFFAGKPPTKAIAASSASENLPRPFVSIRIKGPIAARRLKSALLDTGSQDTLFPMDLAEPLGIVLGGERAALKWRGQRYWVEFHKVELELAQDGTAWRWRARVGFTPAPLAYALLGQRGCLELLDAKFRGADQIVELETNRAFPGSTSTA